MASSNNATPAAEETAAFSERWTPGQVLAGKYVVEHVVGAGAMAIVVSAMHRQLDTRVAIKFLRPEMLGKSDLVSRFRREGRAAAKIRSKHVARVFDVGELEDGTPFMVMEYLEGNDLAQVLEDRGPLPVGETIGYAIQVCEALAGAHALGIVHRDIKPANIFLQSDGDSGCVKLLDFGISKAVPGAPGLGDLSLTQTVSLMGSPLYMSPEQLRETRVADARSDIWSLGVVVYELLTGEVAFNAESITKLTATILEGSPKPICAFRPDVPPELESVIHRCLAKDATLRYQSVIELARDLMPYAPEESRLAAERSPLLRGVSGASVPPGSGAPWSSRVPPPASGPMPLRRGSDAPAALGASPPGGGTLQGAATSTLASASGPARSAVGSSLFPMGVAVEGGAGAAAAARALEPSARTAPRGRFVAVGLVALAALGGGYRLWSPARPGASAQPPAVAAPTAPPAPASAAFAPAPAAPGPAPITSPHEASAEARRPPPAAVAKGGARPAPPRPPAGPAVARPPSPKGSAQGSEPDLGY
ncbi:MAG TPA: serine/threonine-protein kinase [Polyangiaceae bacterium]|nr:serine/threonine-protein kinase [Polyangiaceae bacterium]